MCATGPKSAPETWKCRRRNNVFRQTIPDPRSRNVEGPTTDCGQSEHRYFCLQISFDVFPGCHLPPRPCGVYCSTCVTVLSSFLLIIWPHQLHFLLLGCSSMSFMPVYFHGSLLAILSDQCVVGSKWRLFLLRFAMLCRLPQVGVCSALIWCKARWCRTRLWQYGNRQCVSW